MERNSVTERPLTEVERVYHQHSPAIWRAVLLYCGDKDIASDAVAEAFAQALYYGDKVRSLERWIWKTAFLLARRILKERGNVMFDVPQHAYQLPDGSVELFDVLRRLSRAQRAAVILHYYADYSIRDVATLLGSTPAAVGVHLHRARRKLRILLEEEDA